MPWNAIVIAASAPPPTRIFVERHVAPRWCSSARAPVVGRDGSSMVCAPQPSTITGTSKNLVLPIVARAQQRAYRTVNAVNRTGPPAHEHDRRVARAIASPASSEDKRARLCDVDSELCGETRVDEVHQPPARRPFDAIDLVLPWQGGARESHAATAPAAPLERKPSLRGEDGARQLVKARLRDHPARDATFVALGAHKRLDARANRRDRQPIDLAERARILRREARHLPSRIGLGEVGILLRPRVEHTKREDALVLVAQRAEIAGPKLGAHGAILKGMTDKRREVEELRAEIGKLDTQLLATLERRAKLSKKIGDLRSGLSLPPALPDRGQIEALVGKAQGEIPQGALREIFREIFATCFSIEQPVVVSYAGLEGGFAHSAARSRFGVSANYVCSDNVAVALEEVARQRATYAVVPFETRADGLLASTIAALTTSELKIVAAFEMVMNLQLATKASSVAEIEKVYAIAKDRAHCMRFLATELPGAQVLDVKSPLAACQLAAADPRAAALVHEGFTAEFALETIKRNVRDDGDERVRYIIVGTRPSSRTGTDLTAFVLSVNDSPGALHEVLKQFAERGVNLTKIQSRPTPGESWQYIFFIEVQGHATDRPLVGAIEEVRRQARFFKVLGSYTAT
jgi:chorismate mutase/prephenate dehydratase